MPNQTTRRGSGTFKHAAREHTPREPSRRPFACHVCGATGAHLTVERKTLRVKRNGVERIGVNVKCDGRGPNATKPRTRHEFVSVHADAVARSRRSDARAGTTGGRKTARKSAAKRTTRGTSTKPRDVKRRAQSAKNGAKLPAIGSAFSGFGASVGSAAGTVASAFRGALT